MSCFGSEYIMAEHFTRFTRKKWANYWLKTQQEQQEDNSTDDICCLENVCELNKPLSPKLPDKQAIEDELDIDGGKPVLACF